MRYQKSCVSCTSERDNGILPVVKKLTFVKLRYPEYGAGAQTRWLWRTQEGTNNLEKSIWKKATTVVNVMENFST